MAAEQPTTANEYILHHLTFLSNKEPKGIVDFSVIHLDTVFFSVALALLFGGAFYLAARTATAGRAGQISELRRTAWSSSSTPRSRTAFTAPTSCSRRWR